MKLKILLFPILLPKAMEVSLNKAVHVLNTSTGLCSYQWLKYKDVGKLTNLSSPAGLAVLTLASHVSGQGSIPGESR